MPTDLLPADAIFAELMLLQEKHPHYQLLQFERLASARQYARLYGLVSALVPPGACVLDWGCGNGHFSYALLRSGYRVSAFTMEAHRLPPDLERWYPDYELQTGRETDPVALPYGNDSFDAVTSVGVLEHVRETGGHDLATLREVGRVLRPGGWFICYHLPNRGSWIEGVSRFTRRYHHPYRYGQGDIVRLCRASGLQLGRVERYGILPRNFWSRLPAAVGNSTVTCGVWDWLDAGLGRVLAPLCQNFLFAARKPVRAARGAQPFASRAAIVVP